MAEMSEGKVTNFLRTIHVLLHNVAAIALWLDYADAPLPAWHYLDQQPTQVLDKYDTRCYFNVRSKADISQLNLPHGTDN